MKKVSLAALAALTIGLAGCYEPTDVTVAEPGVYKGPKDDLLDADAKKRSEELIARFNQVQRDR